MQQALYNNISGTSITGNNISGTSITGNGIGSQAMNTTTARTAPKTAGLLRWVTCRWDMVGVLTLMGSSAAYGVFALAHVGL